MPTDKEFLRNLRKRPKVDVDPEVVDPEQVRAEWIEELDSLHTRICEWLRSAEDEKLLSIKSEMGPVEEEILGKYEAPTLRIRIASGEEVRLLPLRLVIGFRGRVKMECWERYRYLFRTEHEWVVAWQLSPLRYESLDASSFQRALQDVLPALR